ncbi:MAG: hypothetical protein JXB15_00810 [Anaerolineales bacterium]|nr:hypothetical protein [Anaerolineales bacterium]
MAIPALVLGFIISTLYGLAFHLIRGGNAGRLFIYMILAWVGFALGQLLGEYLGWNFFSVGTLRLGMASLVSAIFLLGGHWLSQIPGNKEKK